MDTLTPDQRSSLMGRVKQRDTAPELRVRSLLHQHGLRFRLQKPRLPGKPDIIFPGLRRVIFVHGCFWHGHQCPKGKLPTSNTAFWSAKIERNRLRDGEVERGLKDLGWSVLVIWECQLKDETALWNTLAEFLQAAHDF